MSLPPDLVEMLGAFAEDGVRYLVIGGHAVSLHSRPRSTKDLDVLLDPAADNVARACGALRRFGVPASLVAELRSAGAQDIVWLGRAPARVDFLLSAPGVRFASAYGRRVTHTIAGVAIDFIGKEDLLANKRAVGRPVDKRDVRALLAAKPAEPTKPARPKRSK